jgi:hypothetical protein
MKKFIAIVIIGSFVAVVVLVTTIDLFRGKNAPQPQPSALSAAETSVADLIFQLADEDVKKRNEAFDALRKIGEPALPHLEKSLKAVNPNVAATIRTLIGLISGKIPEALAQQPPPNLDLPELPKPAAPAAQPPPEPQPRKETEAQWRARFEALLAQPTPQGKNLRDMVKIVREGNTAALEYAERMWGWDGNDIRRYLQMELVDRPKPVPTDVAGLSLNLMDSLGAVLSAGGDGVRVSQVKAASAAATAGLMAGDVVTQINGRPVASLDDARALISAAEKGRQIKMEIQRKGEEMTLTIPNP